MDRYNFLGGVTLLLDFGLAGWVDDIEQGHKRGQERSEEHYAYTQGDTTLETRSGCID